MKAAALPRGEPDVTLVMKFGGSSVANRAQIEKVLEIVRADRDARPLVVSSAHKGITNALVAAADAAARGRYLPETVVDAQTEVARSLECPDTLMAPFFRELEDLLRGVQLVQELSPRSLDYVSSFGERMAVRCLADFFSRQGLPARAYDAWELGFVTDDRFNAARPLPDFPERARLAVDALSPDEVPIVTGFVGRNRRGEITTVGRNGSDLTATLFGAALGAQEVQIWSDTDGVLTADPSMVPAARNIPTMRFEEAAELAFFGSRVLHPGALLPALERGIPVSVRNTNRPDHPGTVIRRDPPVNPSPATSIAYKEGQQVLTIRSTRMFGQAGFLAPVFQVLGRHGLVVDMLATSEISVSMTLTQDADLAAVLPELERLGTCEVQRGKTLLCVVGQHLPTRPGLAAKVLEAIAGVGVNVEMLSYAVGSINFSMLVDDADVGRAVPVLHRLLFETDGDQAPPAGADPGGDDD